MAQVSYGTITITDTNDIERIYTVYAKSTTNTTAPSAAASSWTESISTAPGSGDYIWQRTVVEKSGTGELTYGDPVCVTGPEGDPGATGKGVKSLVTQYYLSTSSSSVAGGSWSATPQSYPTTGTKYYWTKTITTYTDNTTYESTAVYDVALTSSVKDARDANVTADEAKGIAQQASIDITNLQTRTKYFWTNLTAHTNGTSGWTKPDYPVGTFAASGISGTTFDYENSSTYGYNTLYSNGIKLRYNAINLGELTGTALTFYHPSITSQSTKAMELGATALKFYDATGSNVQAEFGGTKARVSGTIEALDGKIGSSENNYWIIDTFYDANQQESYSSLHSSGDSFIQLGDTNTWTIGTNKISSSWRYMSTSSEGITNPYYFRYKQFASGEDYYDYGIHIPSVLKASGENTNLLADKFLYIRQANYVNDGNLNQLELDSSWTYKFYIDGDGNLYAKNLFFFDENGNSVQVGGADGAYLPKTGGTITENLEVNGTLTKGGKNVAYLTATPTNGKILIADGTTGGIKTSGYTIATSVPQNAVFTDKNVQTTKANTTKIYLTGTPTNETSTSTLNFDEYVYVDTTAGALHATTFNGYTLAAAAAKGVDTSMTSTSTSTNLPTTKAVADLIATYLPLAGGTISGAVDINDELYADGATFGNLIVNGVGRFTNGIYGDLIGNVTGSITGNAATADKVNHNLVIKLASGTTEGTNMFTFNGSVAKTVDITKSALGLGNVENKSSATIRGELTSANVTTALGFTPYNSTNPNGYTSNVGTITGVTAGTGLSGGGTSGAVTLNHSNSVTAQTTQGIYPIKIDAQGHISAYGSAPTTLSGYGITDAKIANGVITLGSNTITPLTSQWTANLYVGKTATDKANAAATNGNVYLNLVENSTVRNAHKIAGSGTTTVTSDADGNITISSADSKTGTVTSITLTQGTGITIGSSGTAITTSGSRTIGLADNYGDTKNPYASKTARYVLAAPADVAGVPTFRALTGADVGLGNVLNAAQVTGIGQGADGKIRVYKGDSNYEDVAVEIVATESSTVASAQKLTSYGGSTKQPVYFPNSGTNAGKPVAIGYTIETSVPSGAVFTDTTYTFAGSTNGFTVTPLNGTAQTVTVTPSIANNITGSGTSGYLAKFNGANTITNGPALGTDTTKFLNNKGEWSVPTNTNTTYTLTNALASHKFTWTFTAGGSGSGSTTTIAELAAGTGISLTDDTNNKKITIGNAGVTGVKGNLENDYRTGQVNLTPANLGAVATTGDESISGKKVFDDILQIKKTIRDSSGQHYYGGAANRSQWYKITLAHNGVTPPSSNQWYMCSMTIHIAGDYQSCPRGTIELCYYIYWNGTTYLADRVYATGYGPQINKAKVYYNLTDPFVIYVDSSNAYTSIWVDYISYRDSAQSHNIKETKVEVSSAITVADYTIVPTTYIYTADGTSIYASNHLRPSINNSLNLGDSSYKWANIYATTFTGNLTGNVTGTASGNVTSVQYDSTNTKFTYTKNGSNTDIVTIANLKTYLGLKALAYKDSLTKSDVGLSNVNDTADADKRVKGANITTTTNAVARYSDTNGTFADSTTTFDGNNLIIGSTDNPGNLKIGAKNDNYGLMPNTSNYNQIGSSSLYWYRSYITHYYGTQSHITSWDAGKNIGTAVTSGAASTLGSVNFYNTCAAGGTQTKTLLTADSTANSNITITLPKTTGTLALTSEIPTNYVTLNTVQNITANKIFSAGIKWTAESGTNPSKFGACSYDSSLEALVFSFS